MRRKVFAVPIIVIFGLYLFSMNFVAGGEPMSDPTVTLYGEINPEAPSELRLFAFLIGSWTGTGKTRMEDDTWGTYELTWIGRYILDGRAVADEIHALDPEGKPYLGITLRFYDPVNGNWIIEYLNVTGAFLRKQVGPLSGSVTTIDNVVTVNQAGSGALLQEHYNVLDQDHFVYSLDMSKDDGQTWERALVEMTMRRMEQAAVAE
jgi:hypothetical protein